MNPKIGDHVKFKHLGYPMVGYVVDSSVKLHDGVARIKYHIRTYRNENFDVYASTVYAVYPLGRVIDSLVNL